MQLITPFRLLALVCALLSFSAIQARPSEPVQNKQISKTLSLVFIENGGQVTDQYRKQRKDIDFKLSAPGLNIFVGDGQMHYMWVKNLKPRAEKPTDMKRPRRTISDTLEKVETYRLDVVLLGANPNAQLIMEEQQSYYENYQFEYFEGTIHTYRKAVYKDIYPNIDWVLYINDNELKYDFVVNPGGDPQNIKLQYKGVTAINIKEGSVIATTPYGSITEHAPYTYDALTKAELRSSFALHDNTLSFDIAGSTKNGIVIDPALGWETYYGGSSADWLNGVTSNKAGDAFICGSSGSSNNIVTTGAAQSTIVGPGDAFIAVFNTVGQRQWATYFGGNGGDGLSNVELDGAGNIYGCGITSSSSGIATSGAFQVARGGFSDHMLIKLIAAEHVCGALILVVAAMKERLR